MWGLQGGITMTLCTFILGQVGKARNRSYRTTSLPARKVAADDVIDGGRWRLFIMVNQGLLIELSVGRHLPGKENFFC